MNVGILALQGAVEPHARKLEALQIPFSRVLTPTDLSSVDALILPGGESTAMLKLIEINRLWEPLFAFVHSKPTVGFCAGTILLAGRVENPTQTSFRAVDIEVSRNGFGRQIDSFVGTLESSLPKFNKAEAVFIRAPRIMKAGRDVSVLATWNGEPVLVEEKNVLAATFHPELSQSAEVHSYFIEKCRKLL